GDGGDMAKLLILGFGYLGEAVIACHPDKHKVKWFATTRSAQRAEEIQQDWQGEPIVCDVLRPESLQLPQVDTVLYCVGFDRRGGCSMRDVYVKGLGNVLERLPRPRRLVYVSSTGVYAQSDGSWVNESSQTEPVDESGSVALEAEGVLRGKLPEAIILR